MSITVRDCMMLPAFRTSKLVAGEGGLDRIVSSVSVVEFSSNSVFNPNELLVSAFYEIRDDPEAQCREIEGLVRTGAVALMLFYVNDILGELAPEVVNTADRLDLPLIVVDDGHTELKYSDVITDVMDAVVRDRLFNENSLSLIRNRLAQFPCHMRNMESLLMTLSDLYKCNLVLKLDQDVWFTACYRPSADIFDPERCIREFQNEPAGFGVRYVGEEREGYYVYKMSFYHVSKMWTTLYASCHDELLTAEMLRDMCSSTNLYTELWGYSLDIHKAETLTTLLLKSSDEMGAMLLERSGIEMEAISNLMVICSKEGIPEELKKEMLEILRGSHKIYAAAPIDGTLVVLSALSWADPRDEIILSDIVSGVRQAGVYMFLDSGNESVSALRETYVELCKNMEYLRKVFLNKHVWEVHDLFLVQEAASLLTSNTPRRNRVQNIIRSLEEDSNKLMDTLAVYLIDNNGQMNKTAEELFLHRNTVAYRLSRIRQLTNTDFTKMPATGDFYMAASLWRLSPRLPETN